jgi:hypothetical protein
MPNTELLQRTLAQIEAHPEAWNQEAWASKTDCGTAYCFAGHAVALTYPDAVPMFEGASTTGFVSIPQHPERTLWYVPDLAGEVLGLTHGPASILFDCVNTLDDLRAMVADLVAGGDLERFLRDDYENEDGDDDA